MIAPINHKLKIHLIITGVQEMCDLYQMLMYSQFMTTNLI
jgi:hypothetical protein